LQHTERLHKLYPELYREGSNANQEVASFGKKWSWYSSIYGIAKGNIFNFEAATKLPLNTALMYLSFEADKNRMESNLIKKK